MIPINKRNIGTSILLSIVTFGIYNIYWQYLLVKNTRSIKKDNSSCTGEMLCLIFVPYYSLYWWFTRGKRVKDEFASRGYSATGSEIAYLIFGALGLGIVSMAIMQNDFNSLPPEVADASTQSSHRSTKIHEPPFHIVKRPAIVWWKALLIRTVAIIAALGVSSIVLYVLTKKSPLEAMRLVYEASFGAYKKDLGTGFFTQIFTGRRFWTMLQELCMLLVIALAVTPAFKMKYWNLGAQGQVLVGALCSTALMLKLNSGFWITHKWLVLLLMLIAGIVGGIVWAVIPALFKAKWNTNESLFTLMMNYIAIQLVSCMINVWVPNGSNAMGVVNQSTQVGWIPVMSFPDSWGMSSSAKNYFYNILIVLLLTVVMFMYLRFSKHGYELTVVGESVNTANYIGINVKKVIVRTLVFSGLLCGVSGFLLVSGTDHSITTGLDRGYGFTAIIVAWLAKFNPLMMVITSFLIVFLDKGASDIAMNMGFNESVGDIITGIIIFFIIGCEFFINYKIVKTHREG